MIFQPSPAPRVYGLPPGADFPAAVYDGLLGRTSGLSPEVLARVEIFVNTRRMQRRLKALFEAGSPCLIPRIRVVSDLAKDAMFADLPPAAPPLRRRLELTRLVARLLDREPGLAPRATMFDLADSLAALMDEMQGEGVIPATVRNLDVADASGHWQRNLKFVSLVEPYFGPGSGRDPDTAARQRMVVERLSKVWASRPPDHPILLAGSTGSRGTTALLMRAVAKLPLGALILPGVDPDIPAPVWGILADNSRNEDHPQFRFARLLDDLGLSVGDIRPWNADAKPPNPSRNRLVSLALRPAPVTDQWLSEGAALTDLAQAMDTVTLVDAPSARAEAGAIALALREAVEIGDTAALITPDRTLTRQVTAALDRWGIVPDDSAGRPLSLSAPGRLLRHVAALFAQSVSVEALLTLLKHPLTSTGSDGRGEHLLLTRELELHLRRSGPPFPAPRDLLTWAGSGGGNRMAWANWIAGNLAGLDTIGDRPAAEHLAHHLKIAESLCAGADVPGSGQLWAKAAGQEAKRLTDELMQEAEYAGTLSPGDYASLFQAILRTGEVREAPLSHPQVMIWGTLEARVQGADLVILGGLNEGIWPESPNPDPWLNRDMRRKAGLLLPERRIGLSAHDFQQAVAARRVIISRSVRDADAQTVPSRWVNRICNLLDGLDGEGARALCAARRRGDALLNLAERLDQPKHAVPAATRPSPRPPVSARPDQISITEVQRLIRDPYAIYARRILRLQRLDPLRRLPDPPLRGTVIHKVFERFIADGPVTGLPADKARLMAAADLVLEAEAPWPAARRLWRAKLCRIADWFLAGEAIRQTSATPIALERKASMNIEGPDVRLTGKIDRIDRDANGDMVIYDYKSGAPPSPSQQLHFDKQLFLAAMMVEQGALGGLSASRVSEVAYIGLGASPRVVSLPVDKDIIAATQDGLKRLLYAYGSRSRGYTSRRAVDRLAFGGDFDHLARFGEWDASAEPDALIVG